MLLRRPRRVWVLALTALVLAFGAGTACGVLVWHLSASNGDQQQTHVRFAALPTPVVDSNDDDQRRSLICNSTVDESPRSSDCGSLDSDPDASLRQSETDGSHYGSDLSSLTDPDSPKVANSSFSAERSPDFQSFVTKTIDPVRNVTSVSRAGSQQSIPCYINTVDGDVTESPESARNSSGSVTNVSQQNSSRSSSARIQSPPLPVVEQHRRTGPRVVSSDCRGRGAARPVTSAAAAHVTDGDGDSDASSGSSMTTTSGSESLADMDEVCGLMEQIQQGLEPLRHARTPSCFSPTQLCYLLQRYNESDAGRFFNHVQFRVRHHEPFIAAVRSAYLAQVAIARSLFESATASESADLMTSETVQYVVYRQLRERSDLHRRLRSVTDSDDILSLLLPRISRSLNRRVRLSLEQTIAQHTDTESVLRGLRVWVNHVQTLFDHDQRGPHRQGLDLARAEILLRTESLWIPPAYTEPIPIDRTFSYVPALSVFPGVRVVLQPSSLESARTRRLLQYRQRLDVVLDPERKRAALTGVTEQRLRLARSCYDYTLVATRAIAALFAAIEAGHDRIPGEYDTWRAYWSTHRAEAGLLPADLMAQIQVEVRAVFLLRKQWWHVQRVADPLTASVTDLADVVEVIAAVYRSCSAEVRERLLVLEECVDVRGRTLRELKLRLDVAALCKRCPPQSVPAIRTLVWYQNYLPVKQRDQIRRIAAALRLREPVALDHVRVFDDVSNDDHIR